MDYEGGKKKAWHVVRLSAGWLLTGVGVLCSVLPVLPGFVFLIPGLAILSAESRWVRDLLRRVRHKHLVRQAVRQAAKAGIKIDLGSEDDGPGDAPPRRPPESAH